MTFEPRFKPGFRYLTTEGVPRSVHVKGKSAVDPDVYVCAAEGFAVALLMNCGSKYDGKLIGQDIWLDESTGVPVQLKQEAA
jgi:hypothetical protein